MDDPREEPGHELASSAPAGVPQQPYAELYQLPSRPQATRRSPSHPQSSSTFEKDEDETFSRPAGVHGPLPPVPHARLPGSDGRIPQLQPVDSRLSGGPRSGIDWIVPVNEKPPPRRSVGERLQPTLDTAIAEKDKYAVKARMTGYALNAAIGIQVIVGSLITGLSASLSKNAGLSTTILGGLNTLVAAYLARARGSNEPELSITRVKDLEQFIRECLAFQMDYGHVVTGEYDERLIGFRRHFEELLGNANGERKLSPV